MKKIIEYLYIFSKLSTSLILLGSFLVFGYFFYVSFKNQEKANNDQIELYDRINSNTKKISEFSKSFSISIEDFNKIKKEIKNISKKNNSKEIEKLNNKINELYSKLEIILSSMEKIEANEYSKTILQIKMLS